MKLRSFRLYYFFTCPQTNVMDVLNSNYFRFTDWNISVNYALTFERLFNWYAVKKNLCLSVIFLSKNNDIL